MTGSGLSVNFSNGSPPTSSGFLNLLTFYSARTSAGLISYRIRLRDSLFRALLLSRSLHCFQRRSPLGVDSTRYTMALSKEAAAKNPKAFIPRQLFA